MNINKENEPLSFSNEYDCDADPEYAHDYASSAKLKIENGNSTGKQNQNS